MKSILAPTPEELRNIADIAEEFTSTLAIQLAQQTDKEITEAIQLRIGMDWNLNTLRGRLDRLCYPDGSEEYHLDGEPLIHFGPPIIHNQGQTLTAGRVVTHLKGKNDEGLPN